MSDITPANAIDLHKLSPDEFDNFVHRSLMQGWIPLARYQELYPTETRDKITSRLQKGSWQRGIHYAVPKGSGAWVNVINIREWVTSSEKVSDAV